MKSTLRRQTTDIEQQIALLEQTAHHNGRVSDLLKLAFEAHSPKNHLRRLPKLSDEGLFVSYGSQAHLLVPEYARITWSPNRYHVTGESFMIDPLHAPFEPFSLDGYLRNDGLSVQTVDFRRVLEPDRTYGLLVLPAQRARRALHAAVGIKNFSRTLQRT